MLSTEGFFYLKKERSSYRTQFKEVSTLARLAFYENLLGKKQESFIGRMNSRPGCISKKCKGFPQEQGKLSRTTRNKEVSVTVSFCIKRVSANCELLMVITRAKNSSTHTFKSSAFN